MIIDVLTRHPVRLQYLIVKWLFPPPPLINASQRLPKCQAVAVKLSLFP